MAGKYIGARHIISPEACSSLVMLAFSDSNVRRNSDSSSSGFQLDAPGMFDRVRSSSSSSASSSSAEESENITGGDMPLIRTVYTSPNSAHLEIKMHEVRRRGIGFQLWPAAVASCYFMDVVMQQQGLGTVRGKRVIELGAGTGLVGMCAAALGAQSVSVTDLAEVLPNLRANVTLNQHLFTSADSVQSDSKIASDPLPRISVAPLCWGVDQHKFRAEDLDVILIADGVYWENLFQPLLDTLRHLSSAENVIFLAQLKRRKLEGRFFKKARKWFRVSEVYAHVIEGVDRPVRIYEFRKLDAVMRPLQQVQSQSQGEGKFS
jgi:predicted nicotinamide N-methyase